jgi:hypothetical protein
MARVKRGRDRIRSQGYRDGLNHNPVMTMDREETYRSFASREIVEDGEDFEERKRSNKRLLDEVQSGYHSRRIRR